MSAHFREVPPPPPRPVASRRSCSAVVLAFLFLVALAFAGWGYYRWSAAHPSVRHEEVDSLARRLDEIGKVVNWDHDQILNGGTPPLPNPPPDTQADSSAAGVAAALNADIADRLDACAAYTGDPNVGIAVLYATLKGVLITRLAGPAPPDRKEVARLAASMMRGGRVGPTPPPGPSPAPAPAPSGYSGPLYAILILPDESTPEQAALRLDAQIAAAVQADGNLTWNVYEKSAKAIDANNWRPIVDKSGLPVVLWFAPQHLVKTTPNPTRDSILADLKGIRGK